MKLLFKQFTAEDGCNAYLVGDPSTKRSALIDPRADEIDLYLDFAAQSGAKIDWVIDTHTHADHYSGSHLVAENFSAKIGMGSATKSNRVQQRLKDQEVISLGNVTLRILETPGHTPDSISVVANFGHETAVFTGDTLFIGGSGRTDFPGADPRQQFTSLHKVLAALPDNTWVFPGHDYSDLLFSTIGFEKKTNPHYLMTNIEEFVRMKNAEIMATGTGISQVVEYNLAEKPTARIRAGVQASCGACVPGADALAHAIEKIDRSKLELEANSSTTQCIDVREPSEFRAGQIPNFKNIPMSEVFLHWNELQTGKKIFSCQRGGRSKIVAQTLVRLGLTQVADFSGGYLAWATAKQ